jgi:hypothetical protein
LAGIFSEIGVDSTLGSSGYTSEDAKESAEDDTIEDGHPCLLDGSDRRLPRLDLDARELCGL